MCGNLSNLSPSFCACRIGNIGRLNVRKVRPIYDRDDFHRWVVGESPPAASVLDLDPSGRDLLYVGGVPDLYRSEGDLQSDGRLVGAVFAIEVRWVDGIVCNL